MGCCNDCLTCDIAFNAVMSLSRASTRGSYSRIEGVTKVNLSGRRRSRIAAKGPFPQALLAGSHAPESIPAGIGNIQQAPKFASKLSALRMLITCYV